MAFVVAQARPVIAAELHPACEAFRPIIASRNSIVIFHEIGHENVARTEGACDRVPVSHDEIEEVLHLRVVPPPLLAADAVATPDQAEVLTRGDRLWTADQGSEETVHHLKNHRALAARKHATQAVVLGIGEWSVQRCHSAPSQPQ